MKAQSVKIRVIRVIRVLYRQCPPVLTVGLGLLLSLNVLAQSNLRLSGQVYDRHSRLPLAGVNVEVAGTPYGAVSDADGFFQIENIPPGSYTLRFSMIGYHDARQNDVDVSTELPRRLSVALTPATIAGDSVIVTAGREDSGSSLEGDKLVLTADDIARYAALGLPQLLQQAAGVEVTSTGGGDSRAQIRIHGSRASQVLVLLDGQRLNNPQTGEVDLGEIPLEQIERIEIVRQGNSAMFGGNAFAGVVSFRTRALQERGYAGLRTRGGAFHSARGEAGGGITLGRTGLHLQASYLQDYSQQDFNFEYDGETLTRQNAWYRNRKFFGKISYQGHRQQANLRYHHRRGGQGLPSSYFEAMPHDGAFSDGASDALQLQHQWFFSRRGYLESSLGYHHLTTTYDNTRAASPFLRYHTRQENTVLEGRLNGMHFPASFLELRWGLNYQEERLDQENLLLPAASIGQKRRHTAAGVAGAEVDLPGLGALFSSARLRGALRYESYFSRATQGYPLAGLSLVPAALPWVSVSGSWGKAIRYPDFNSLFWKGDARARGNPELQPERKTFWNTSIRFGGENEYLPVFSAFYYRERIRDLIFWHRAVSGVWEPRNEERARQQGVDVQLSQKLVTDHLHFQAAYSFIEALNESTEPNRRGREIVFIPRHTLNSSLWLGLGPLHALLVYRTLSERQTVPANTAVPLSAYDVWDLSLNIRHEFGPLQLDAGYALKNLGGTSYELLRGYPMPGREYQVSLSMNYVFKNQ